MSMMLLITEQIIFKCLFLSGPVRRTLDNMFLGSHNDRMRYVILSVNPGSASLSNLLKVYTAKNSCPALESNHEEVIGHIPTEGQSTKTAGLDSSLFKNVSILNGRAR